MMIDRGPRDRLHVPRYRDECYYGNPAMCWLCQFRPIWFALQMRFGPRATLAVLIVLLTALAVVTLIAVSMLFKGVLA